MGDMADELFNRGAEDCDGCGKMFYHCTCASDYDRDRRNALRRKAYAEARKGVRHTPKKVKLVKTQKSRIGSASQKRDHRNKKGR